LILSSDQRFYRENGGRTGAEQHFTPRDVRDKTDVSLSESLLSFYR